MAGPDKRVGLDGGLGLQPAPDPCLSAPSPIATREAPLTLNVDMVHRIVIDKRSS